MKQVSKLSKILTKKFLIKEYIQNKKSLYQIGELLNCSHCTIRNYLIKNGISIRTHAEVCIKYSKILTKTFLIKEYVINKKTIKEIAKQVDCSYTAVRNNIELCKIKFRTNSEAQFLLERKGTKCPTYIDGRTNKKYYCKEADCNNEISYENHRNGQCRCESCSTKRKHKLGVLNSKGKYNPNFQGGLSNFPYPLEFSNKLKSKIRKRDNYTCQKCGITEKDYSMVYGNVLAVHHIDYNKENCKETNLTTLCNKCNSEVNFNRDYWTDYFNKRLYKNATCVV